MSMLDPLSRLPPEALQQFLLINADTEDTGCPCGQNCCREENARLRAENARLAAAVVDIDQILTSVSAAVMSARMRLAVALGTAADA